MMAQLEGEASADVGTEVLYENDKIKVWSMTLEPFQSSAYHRHVHDYAFVYTTPSRISVEQPGLPDVVKDFEREFVQYSVVGDGIEHRITNMASEPHNQIIIEFKGPSESPADPLTPDTNGRMSG